MSKFFRKGPFLSTLLAYVIQSRDGKGPYKTISLTDYFNHLLVVFVFACEPTSLDFYLSSGRMSYSAYI